ncbi:MAG: hypothetical protein AB1529_02125 [Candidatus Micrarchaeota archaeon]
MAPVEPQVDGTPKSSRELKAELMDRSCKSRLIGGTIVAYTSHSNPEETLRDTIKRVEHGQGRLKITTYRGRLLDICLLDADTELKEERGVIRIDCWPIECFAVAAKGVEIPRQAQS